MKIFGGIIIYKSIISYNLIILNLIIFFNEWFISFIFFPFCLSFGYPNVLEIHKQPLIVFLMKYAHVQIPTHVSIFQ